MKNRRSFVRKLVGSISLLFFPFSVRASRQSKPEFLRLYYVSESPSISMAIAGVFMFIDKQKAEAMRDFSNQLGMRSMQCEVYYVDVPARGVLVNR